MTSLVVVYPLDTYRIHLAMSYHKTKDQALFTKFRDRVGQLSSVKKMYQGFWAANLISVINFNFYRHVGAALGQLQIEGVP